MRLGAVRRSTFFLLSVFLIGVCPAFAAGPADAEQPVRLSADVRAETVTAMQTVEVWLTADVAGGWHINSHRPAMEYLIPTDVRVTAPEGFTVSEVAYPAGVRKVLSFDESPLDLYEGRTVFKWKVHIADVGAGVHRMTAALRYQACDDEKCLPRAEARLDIPLTVAPLPQAHPSPQLDYGLARGLRIPNPPEESVGGNAIAHLMQEKGVFLALLLIFWGGVALNLTPCVYPMIPITVAFFGGRGPSRRPVTDAVAYFLGLVLVFSALGTVAGLTGGFFGAALQNPPVLIALSLLMLYLSAGMFGWVGFGLPASWAQRVSGGSAPLGAFGMGATMGVVAAPCIGPFVVALLAYVGSRQSPALGFLLFSVLSAGLGLPYLLLGLFSERIPALPKLGAWMDVVKWCFGFVLLGLAVYFCAPLIPDAAERALFGLTLLAACGTAAWVCVKRARRWPRLWAGLSAIGLAVVGASFFLTAPREDAAGEFWLPYDAASFDAARAAGRPVALDFSAEWCLPCKLMDRTTYADPRVRAALEQAVRLKVDLTLYDAPEAQEARERFGISGVPTLIYFDTAGVERIRWVGEFSAEALLSELGGHGS